MTEVVIIMTGVVLILTGVVLIMTEYVITLTVSTKYNWIGPQKDIWFFGACFLLPSLAVKWRLNTDTDTDKSPEGADWPNGQSPSQCCNPWLLEQCCSSWALPSAGLNTTEPAVRAGIATLLLTIWSAFPHCHLGTGTNYLFVNLLFPMLSKLKKSQLLSCLLNLNQRQLYYYCFTSYYIKISPQALHPWVTFLLH